MTDCIESDWLRDRKGYGRKHFRSGHRRAHRVAWEQANGPIPDGLWVLHHCDNPACVRLDHLYLGTNADNVRDRVERGRERHLVGSAHPNAKLNEALVAEMRRLNSQGVTAYRLAKLFFINKKTAEGIVAGKAWKHV